LNNHATAVRTRSAKSVPSDTSPIRVSDETLARLTAVFKLLSDSSRLKIVLALAQDGELHVSALCAMLNQTEPGVRFSQPAVSHHLTLMRMVGLVGFRQTSVPYDRDPRTAGKSKYNQAFGSILIGLNGVVGFSRYPLQLISMVGIAFAALAFMLTLAYGCLKLAGQGFPVGNPTIVIVVSFFSGIQMLSLGVIGEYVGRIYDEARNRPKFIVESAHGLSVEAPDRRELAARAR